MIPDGLDHRTILAGLSLYIGLLLVTEAVSGEHPERAASVGLPLLALAWLGLHPSGRSAAGHALSGASSALGAASASLARAGMAVSGVRP